MNRRIAFSFLSLLAGISACTPKQTINEDPRARVERERISINTTVQEMMPEGPTEYKPDSTSSIVEIVTPKGVMKVEVYCTTPHHKENFLYLIKKKEYNGMLFHRVIQGFMIQGGDPDSKGAPLSKRLGGNSIGYPLKPEFDERHHHVKGALCAARLGDDVNPMKESSGSQFYIVQGRPSSNAQLDQLERAKGFTYTLQQRRDYLTTGGTPQLDKEYTVFGRVFEGLNVIDSLAAVKVNGEARPMENMDMKIYIVKE